MKKKNQDQNWKLGEMKGYVVQLKERIMEEKNRE